MPNVNPREVCFSVSTQGTVLGRKGHMRAGLMIAEIINPSRKGEREEKNKRELKRDEVHSSLRRIARWGREQEGGRRRESSQVRLVYRLLHCTRSRLLWWCILKSYITPVRLGSEAFYRQISDTIIQSFCNSNSISAPALNILHTLDLIHYSMT